MQYKYSVSVLQLFFFLQWYIFKNSIMTEDLYLWDLPKALQSFYTVCVHLIPLLQIQIHFFQLVYFQNLLVIC